MKKLLAAIFSTSMLVATAYADESVYYVQSNNATVRADASFSAKVIAKVEKGKALTVESKNGNWLKIKVDGKTGYISSFVVSNQKPLEKQGVIKADETQEIAPSARRRASSFTSAAAARGLTNDEKSREGDTKADFKAVDKMESMKVTPTEVNKFKETGK